MYDDETFLGWRICRSIARVHKRESPVTEPTPMRLLGEQMKSWFFVFHGFRINKRLLLKRAVHDGIQLIP